MNILKFVFGCCRQKKSLERERIKSIKDIIELHEEENDTPSLSNTEKKEENEFLKDDKSTNESDFKKEDEAKSLIPDYLIRSDEKEKIDFSTRGIIELIEKLSEGEWTHLYTKDNLNLRYKSDTLLSKSILLGNMKFKLAKTEFPNCSLNFSTIAKIVYRPEHRLNYDKSIKEYKIYEETDDYFVFRICYQSPIFFISERDIVDKRISFDYGDKYFSFASSTENYKEAFSPVVRCNTFINSMVLSQDEDFIYFDCLSQVDMKMHISDKILNMLIPAKASDWIRNFVGELKKYTVI